MSIFFPPGVGRWESTVFMTGTKSLQMLVGDSQNVNSQENWQIERAPKPQSGETKYMRHYLLNLIRQHCPSPCEAINDHCVW